MPIEAVIFDCDGTLVDSEPLANAALVECIAPFGLRMTAQEAMQAYVGGKMADCVADLERRLGRKLPDSFVPQVRKRTAEVFRARLEAVDGALEVLADLRLPFCVASSGPMEKIELSLGLTGLAGFLHATGFSARTTLALGSLSPDCSCTRRARWAYRLNAAPWWRTASAASRRA